MIRRALLLIAAVLIGWHLDPTAGPLEGLAWLGCITVGFIALVCLFAHRKDVTP